MKYPQLLKDKKRDALYEAIWEFCALQEFPERELAKVLVDAVEYKAVLSAEIYNIVYNQEKIEL